MKFIFIFLIAILTPLSGFSHRYAPPREDPIFEIDYELEKEVVPDEIYVTEVISGSFFGASYLKYFIQNSSNEPFYELVKLKNGLNWKDLAQKGYLFNIWLTPKEKLEFIPSKAGWVVDEEKNKQSEENLKYHDIDNLVFNYLSSKQPRDVTGEAVLTYKIPVFRAKKIYELVLKKKVNITIDTYNRRREEKLDYWFEENPIKSLEIAKIERRNYNQWYFKFNDENDEGVIFLDKYKYEFEIFKDIPSEYYPIQRLKNNKSLYYGLELTDYSDSNYFERVITFHRGKLGHLETYGLTNHLKDLPEMPEELVIPPPQNFEIPCFFLGELCSIKGKLIWKKNDNFTPLKYKKNELLSCSGSTCIEAMKESRKPREAYEKTKIKSFRTLIKEKAKMILLYSTFYSPLIFNIFFFLTLKIKKIYTSGYFKTFLAIIFYSLFDCIALISIYIHIYQRFGPLYQVILIFSIGLCWAFIKFLLLQLIKKKIKISQRRLFSFVMSSCVAIVWAYFLI